MMITFTGYWNLPWYQNYFHWLDLFSTIKLSFKNFSIFWVGHKFFQTGRSRGFSFIYFEHLEDAKAAKEAMNDQVMTSWNYIQPSMYNLFEHTQKHKLYIQTCIKACYRPLNEMAFI